MTTENKKRSNAKHDQILKVAGELFLQHGFGNVTMDAIAESAPVSKPTLYKHFKNKAALFFAVIGTRTDELFESLENAIATDLQTRETLIEIARRFLDILFKPEAVAMYRIMIAEGTQFPELGQVFFKTGPEHLVHLIAAYLLKEHHAGHLYVPNPELSAGCFISMLKGSTHTQCLMQVKKKYLSKNGRH